MALDEALMDSVREGARPALRLYRWRPACLSLGRNQPAAECYDRAEIARRGLDVVRRPTGGRAVIHARELTYSVVVNDRRLGGLRQSYVTINRALLEGLAQLGVRAVLQPGSARRAPVPSTEPCFRDPAEGELVIDGRKLIGSAQYRHRGVVLQHGSLLLQNDQSVLASLERAARPTPDSPPAILADYLSPLPTWKTLSAALAAGWTRVVGERPEPSEPSREEVRRAELLQRKHADLEWIWRR